MMYNLYNAVCQLYLNKTGEKTDIQKHDFQKLLTIFDIKKSF